VAGIYSARFVRASGSAGTFTYTVPAGHIASVKWVDVLNFGTVSATSYVQCGGMSIAVIVMPASSSKHLEVGCVVYAGEQIALTTETAAVNGQISGFLFLQPAARLLNRGADEPDQLAELPAA